MRQIIAFFVIALIFAAIPALIALMVYRKTTTENLLREYREEVGDPDAEARVSGSYPEVFARAPSALLVVLAVISGATASFGLSSLIGGTTDANSIKASGWGILIFFITVMALFHKHRELRAAKRYAESKKL